MAIIHFNKTIKKIMRDLGFKGFELIQISLDDYRLYVMREGFVPQSIFSLSTTEKYTIAVALQLALLKSYTPDIPILLLDEVILSYDPQRKNKIIDYLRQQCEESNLTTIITRVGKNTLKVETI